MLAALPGHVVIAEAHSIDQALRAHLDDPGVTDDQRITWLRGLVSALGQPRPGGETRYFVKFDSWSILELPLIRRAFPSMPWLFVYRDPVEVMASHRQRPGVHLVPGLLPPHLFGLDRESALEMPADEYGARVLAAVCGAALTGYGSGGGMLINYTFRRRCGSQAGPRRPRVAPGGGTMGNPPVPPTGSPALGWIAFLPNG
jgi:hypothetical protein